MLLDVMRAVLILYKFCLKQQNCKECPIRELCGKMPCEW